MLIDLSLDRIHGLFEKLSKPHESLPPVIHIAGTNGKGSVLAFLTAILEAHGDKVQRFSSPHLVSFHERINLPLEKDNQFKTSPIPEDQLVDVLQRTKDVNGEDPITFFEITTCCCLSCFFRN